MGAEVRRQPWLRECMFASACTLPPCFIQVSNERLVVPICVKYTVVYTVSPKLGTLCQHFADQSCPAEYAS